MENTKNIEFTLKSDIQNPFNINIFISDRLLLNIAMKSINNENEISINDSYSFDYIIKQNKYFLICNNIYEILELIQQTIENKDNVKLIESLDEFTIQIKIPNPFSPLIEFKLKKYKNIDSIINLHKLIKEQNEEIILLKNSFQKQQKTIEILENRIKLLEDKKDIKIAKQNLSNSKILSIEKISKIKEWINPNENISFNFIYRKGDNKFKISDFHKYCDNKGPTLVLIETTKGYKFGGFTPSDWESPKNNTIFKNDNNTFLFSLNHMKKYEKIHEGRSLFVDKNYGPGFGEGCDLLLGYPSENEGEGTNSNYLKNHELTNGEKNFILKEVEVYQVIFN